MTLEERIIALENMVNTLLAENAVLEQEMKSDILEVKSMVSSISLLVAEGVTTQAKQHSRLVNLVDKIAASMDKIVAKQNEFQEWRASISNPRINLSELDKSDWQSDRAARTERGLKQHFNSIELDQLMNELGVNPENIVGETHHARCNYFVGYMSRRSRLRELVIIANKKRPKYPWPIDTGPLS